MAAGPATDVADLLAVAAAEDPDRQAIVDSGGRRMTWGELEDEVGRLATGLGAAGIVAGHRVLVAMGNRIEFVTSYLAILRTQAVAVPVNPSSQSGELARMIADSGSRLVLADADTVTAVRGAVRALEEARAAEHPAGSIEADLVARLVVPRVVVVGGTLQPGERSYDHLRAESARAVPPLQDPEKLAALLYTSGTSGRPRAAMLTHRALLANIEQVAAVEPAMIHGDDVVLGVLPLFHVYGLNAVLGVVMRHRAKLVLTSRFEPQGALDLIEDEACSVVPVAPPVFAYWREVDGLRDRLGPVRLMLSGSAPLSPELAAEFSELTGIPIHQGYGLTEASPVVTSTLCSQRLQPGSVGAALPGIEIRLVDETGRTPDGEDAGEIQIKGANLFSGYWPDGADGPDHEGWWSTGDVGFLDAGGDLFLVDRLKELVIVSGFNVYPVEVEEVIREVPGVAEAAVIGVDDPSTGEAVVAYVVAAVPDAGSDTGSDAGSDTGSVADAVRAHCEQRLARFKQPSRIEVVSELPVGVTGKVQKGRLRGMERRRALGLLEQ
ncbi:MAG TPA: AMP-binding protein [Nocardioides sp.]|uniref:class I adenylate-forming enzyme family protein n=1 Tax=uncultured Nocardioides sp. TaxID=198441 RepID=UPI002614295C|nr:AMP-binding protein [uncultured Nocardioides sp.]HRD63355.1 AMP-binding protein [Nocardioides sp.]HRI96611.1 AMP-binding protein [Nocardioides sp.]